MYVSDFLEGIFPSIKQSREAVGNVIYALGNKLPEKIRTPLDERLRYYSTKCMGYPAIWAIFRILKVPENQFEERLQNHQTALSLSLSTSIIDELIDQESLAPTSDAIIFYLLMYNALDRNEWHNKGLGEFIFAESVATADLFIEKLVKQRTNSIYAQPNYGLKRIGNFHKMIAYDLTKDLDLSVKRRTKIISVVGKFGDWYAAVDDFLDFEIDVANEIQTSFVQGVLLKHFSYLLPAMEEDQKLILKKFKENENYALLIIEALKDMLKEIAHQLADLEVEDFAKEVEGASCNIKDHLLQQYYCTSQA